MIEELERPSAVEEADATDSCALDVILMHDRPVAWRPHRDVWASGQPVDLDARDGAVMDFDRSATGHVVVEERCVRAVPELDRHARSGAERPAPVGHPDRLEGQPFEDRRSARHLDALGHRARQREAAEGRSRIGDGHQGTLLDADDDLLAGPIAAHRDVLVDSEATRVCARPDLDGVDLRHGKAQGLGVPGDERERELKARTRELLLARLVSLQGRMAVASDGSDDRAGVLSTFGAASRSSPSVACSLIR